MNMSTIYKFFLLKKKFLLFIYIIFDYLNYVKIHLVNYIKIARAFDENYATKEDKNEFMRIQAFFVCLVNILFYEKYNSDLVKELFLCSKAPHSALLGCLYLGYYGEYFGEIREHDCENVLLLDLNLYRLGFLTHSRIRLDFWDFREQLGIKDEQLYQSVLKQKIDDFCKKYNCDENDKKIFDELLIFKYSEHFLNNTKWSD